MTPSLFSRETAARSLGYLFIGGATVGVITLILPHDAIVKELPLYGLAALAVAVGLIAVIRGGSFSEPWLHAALALGSLILVAANYFVGSTALYPIVYSWTALYAFAFFRLRAALLHLALIGSSYVVVLIVQDPSSPFVRWLLAIGTPLVAGVLLSRVLELTASRTRVLRENEARTRAIVDGAPDAFASIEADGTVVAWNKEAERTFGIRATEALGRDLADLMFAPEDRAAHLERRRRDLERPSPSAPQRREVEMVRAGGGRFPAEITVSRVSDTGRPLLTVFVRDISDRLQQEREREELYREQAAREEAEQMASIVHGLQLVLDAALAHNRLDLMLEALLPRLCEVLSAESASILLSEEDGSLTVRASTAPFDPEDPPRLPRGAGVAGRVAESRAPLLVRDPKPGDVHDPALHGLGFILGVPLLAGDSITGVIQVGVPKPRSFDDEDLLVLGLAADRVALAIDHARVYEREHKIAETLQRTLLPDRLPELPGLEVAARYLPAASEAEVGGDWYDVIPMVGGLVGLVMGDVAGKGLAAASMVGRLRSAMRAYALEGHSPSAVVERLNRLVWSEVGDTEMATLVLAVVDPSEERITWVNAGHLPPLVIEGPGAASFLDGPRSVPLGVMPFASYEEGSRALPPGATLLLYTDGLVERPGELLDEGLERLIASARGTTGEPQPLCDQMIDALLPAGPASDDVALLAFHTPQLSERFSLELDPVPDRLASMRSLLRRWLRHAAGTEEDIAEILAAAGEAAAAYLARSGTYSIEKARAVLGYEPAIDLAEGMRRTVDWLRREGLLPA